jgi:two-component system LytT family sensor kinase
LKSYFRNFYSVYLNQRRKIITVLIHITVWIIYIFLPYFGPDFVSSEKRFYIRLYSSLIFISFFYLNYFLLIPQIFSKKKYLIYILITAALFVLILYVNKLIHKPPQEIIEKFEGFKRRERHFFINFRISGTFLSFLFGSLALRLLESWNKREKALKEAENERIKTELSYLKHQISPHFLFNSLNSVYSLAVKESKQTPEVVLKLSDLMRYNLENRSKKQVDIADEAEHIQKYIDLQKIRLFDVVQIHFQYDIAQLNGSIEPMLLIPFVENAFKYGVTYHEECRIDFQLKVENNVLYFHSKNKKFNHNQTERNTGIGLKNVRRRLELLYPGRYTLNISDENQLYEVNLTINLKES